MEFDKGKVFTALNADELKIGSKVIVASNVGDLKEHVAVYYDYGNVDWVTIIKDIETENCNSRFVTTSIGKYSLAYLISEPNSVKCEDLNIGDIISDGKIDYMVLGLNHSGGSVSDVFLPCIGWRCNADLKNFYKK